MSKLINAEKEGEVTAERKSKKKTAETKPKGMQVEAGRAYKESLQKRINEEVTLQLHLLIMRKSSCCRATTSS